MIFSRWIVSVALVMFACASQASQYSYESVFSNASDPSLFPGLNLGGVENVAVKMEGDQYMSPKTLQSLVINFKDAAPLNVTNFKLVENRRYLALVSNAWVFNRLLVEVDAVQLTDQQVLDARVYVVDHTSQLSDLRAVFGPELVSVHSPLRDVSPKVLADSVQLQFNAKPLTLQLFDRLGRHDQFGPAQPVPGYDEGFMVQANWQGHGVKTFYLPAPVPTEHFGAYTAIALVLDSVDAPHGTDYFLKVTFEDGAGYTLETQSFYLEEILNQVYPN